MVCEQVSAPSSFLRETRRAPVTFFGIALGFKLIRIGSPFIGSGLSSSLSMSSNSVVNSLDVGRTRCSKTKFVVVVENCVGESLRFSFEFF